MTMSEIIDRLFHGGYDTAKKRETAKIVARYSRGNVSVQNGFILDEGALDNLRKRGDRAAKRLERKAN